jgi:hypothetical protein
MLPRTSVRSHLLQALVAVLTFLPAAAEAHLYVEDFSTLEYCDASATTATWDTLDGEIRLPELELTVVGSCVTPGSAGRIALDGNHAYVCDSGSGLQVIDVSDPRTPALAGALTTFTIFDIVVAGDYAYLAELDLGLHVVDISTPTAPVSIGSCAIPIDATSCITIVGNYVYVTEFFSGLHVIDVSDPTNPLVAGGCGLGMGTGGIAVEGDYAYVATYSGLRVVDISDPTSPSPTGFYSGPSESYGIAVAGDHAYMTAYKPGGDWFEVVDISTPTAPVFAGECALPYGGGRHFAVEGNYAYVRGTAGLGVIDISDPSNPTWIEGGAGVSGAVAVSGDLAFLAGGDLSVVRIAQPVTPPLMAGSCSTPGPASGVAVEGDNAYVADVGTGLQVLDIGDPMSPVIVGGCDTPGYPDAVAASGDHVYVAEEVTGLQVFDVSDTESPVLVGTCYVGDMASDVAVAGDYAYVTEFYSGLHVVDVSDPSNPTQVGMLSLGLTDRIAVAGDHAYITNWDCGLYVVDVSHPTNPVTVGSFGPLLSAHGLAVAGDHLYIAEYFTGLIVVNIADPAHPSLAGVYNMPSGASSVAVAGDFAFLAAGNSGLQVIDVTDPANPVPLGSLDTPGTARCVVVSGDHAFVAGQHGGLQVIEVFQRSFDLGANVGQSLAVDQLDDTIARARITSEQTDAVEWELSADGGASWEEVTSLGVWHDFVHVGTDLRWRSTHLYGAAGVNPACGRLEIEYETEVTPVEQYLVAVATSSGSVTLRWSLESLGEMVGLNVYRSTDPHGAFALVNDEVLAPLSTGFLEDDTVWPGTTFWYELRAVAADGGGVVVLGPVSVSTPGELVTVLYPATPNPFRTDTALVFDIGIHNGPVRLSVLNTAGQLVRVLVDTSIPGGRHTARWDGEDHRGSEVSSGVYFVELRVGTDVQTSKVLLLR